MTFALSLHTNLSLPSLPVLLLHVFVLWQSELIKALVYCDRARLVTVTQLLDKKTGGPRKQGKGHPGDQSGQFSFRLEGPGSVPA